MNEQKNEKSAPRQSACTVFMCSAADQNNIRVVYRYCYHRVNKIQSGDWM